MPLPPFPQTLGSPWPTALIPSLIDQLTRPCESFSKSNTSPACCRSPPSSKVTPPSSNVRDGKKAGQKGGGRRMTVMGEGWGDEITSPLLFLIFQPLPTLFLTSFHEFLKIHQCEVRRGRETCWWRGWEGGRQREGCVS